MTISGTKLVNIRFVIEFNVSVAIMDKISNFPYYMLKKINRRPEGGGHHSMSTPPEYATVWKAPNLPLSGYLLPRSCLIFQLIVFHGSGSASLKAQRVSEAYSGSESATASPGFGLSFKDIPTSVKLLLMNPTFMSLNMAGACEGRSSLKIKPECIQYAVLLYH